MQFVRQIYSDLPDSIIMPVELRHRKVEVIILPIDDIEESQTGQYNVIEIDNITKLSRDELHER
jgi:hypothetical protein